MNIECENMFYFYYLNDIGGVESFFYYLAKKYNNMTIIYNETSPEQIKRLSKYVEVRKYNGQKIKCKRAFFNYNPVIINNVEAEEYIEVVHCVYSELEDVPVPIMHPKFTKYIGVSKVACDSFTKLTGLPCECIYIPVEVDKPKKVLFLVSATRLSDEKGKENMEILGDLLNKLNQPYFYLVFTNDTLPINNPNIIYMNPRLDISPFLKKADFVVQLSNTESFCLTINEALLLGTHVLITDLPVYKELGIKDGIHGYIVKDKLKGFNVKKLYEDLPDFKYNVPKSNWDQYLDNNGKYNPNEIVKVRPIVEYIDIEKNKRMIPNKTRPFSVKQSRATYLSDLGFVEVVE